ncbi:EsaB/YukD family protein [Kitasatospora sp. NPDC096147]|uniref:EsaB/YukD family protein n=1 Tax=Kitasatospora sp. NPDC096147 TaxID=3364093 RepID=UPI00381ECC5A
MRLWIKVHEDDWSGFHQPMGTEFTRGLTPWNGGWPALGAEPERNVLELSVPDATPVRELIDAATAEARNRGLAEPLDPAVPPLRVWLDDPATNTRLPDHRRLDELGVEDGDLLFLCIEQPARAAYSMGAARNPAALLETLQLAMNLPDLEGEPRLWGVLLYTDADPELATYVRTHFHDLHALSGPATRVFVIERYPPWTEARRYWRRRLEPRLFRRFAAMQWLRWQPYDPAGAYQIAARLRVDPALLPCLVLLPTTGPGERSDRRIIFPVEEATPRYFRNLFGGIAEALGPNPPDPRSPGPLDTYAEHQRRLPAVTRASTVARALHAVTTPRPEAAPDAFARVLAAEAAIRARLRPAHPAATSRPGPPHLHFTDCRVVLTSGASVTENFYFQGTNTTFINRPTDTVVRDFQHTYAGASGTPELGRLLTLLLTSRDLSDTDRETAAQLVHEIARDPAAAEPAGPTRMERLRAILASAADIAQPALALLAAAATAFGG